MKKFVCLLAAAFMAQAAYSTENLAQITEQALTASHTLKAAQKSEDAARSQLKAAKGARLPQVSAGADYLHLQNAPAMALPSMPEVSDPNLSALVSRIPDSLPLSKKNSYGFGIGAALPLYAGGRIENTIDAARSAQEAASSAVLGEAQNVKYRAAVAYVTVLRAQKLLAIARGHQAALSEHARNIQNMHAKGYVVKSDLLAAQAMTEEATSEVVQAQNAVALARAALNRLVNRPLDNPLDLAELPDATSLGDKTQKEKEALANSTEIAALTSQIQALDSQAKAEKGKYLPQVSLAAGWAKQDNPYLSKDNTFGVGVVMQWTLFDGGSSWHASDATASQGEALRQKQNEMASLLRLEVTQSFLDYDSAKSRSKVAQAGLTQADDNLRIAKNRYRAGLGTNTEVLDAESLRTRMQSAVALARYDAILSQLRLRRACSAL